jgi:hypothetical protein
MVIFYFEDINSLSGIVPVCVLELARRLGVLCPLACAREFSSWGERLNRISIPFAGHVDYAGGSSTNLIVDRLLIVHN